MNNHYLILNIPNIYTIHNFIGEQILQNKPNNFSKIEDGKNFYKMKLSDLITNNASVNIFYFFTTFTILFILLKRFLLDLITKTL